MEGQRSSHKRRNKSPRWSLPENSASAWMQQVYNQQRYAAGARQNTLLRNVCYREAVADKPTQNLHAQNRRKPRQLSPLPIKPSAVTELDQTLHQLQKTELKLRIPTVDRQRTGASSTSAPKSPLLAIPLLPILASTSSSSGSSSASSPLPDTTPSVATLSAQSRESFVSADQSPPIMRKGQLSPLKPMSGSRKNLHQIQQAPSPTVHSKPQFPFVSAVSPLNPKPRPTAATHKTRNKSPYASTQRQRQRQRKKPTAARASAAQAEYEATADEAHSALQNKPTTELLTIQTDAQVNRLGIPQITIRFATPVPAEITDQCTFNVPVIAIRTATPIPGDESIVNLSNQFIVRAGLAEELGELNNDLQHLQRMATVTPD